MRKTKALSETLAISVFIPFCLWKVMFFSLSYFYRFPLGMIATILISVVAYYYVMFVRHKELGGLFVFLTVILSSLLQFGVMLSQMIGLGGVFSGDEGHPNGSAVLLLVIMVTEPLWINIVAAVIWLAGKLIRFFKEE